MIFSYLTYIFLYLRWLFFNILWPCFEKSSCEWSRQISHRQHVGPNLGQHSRHPDPLPPEALHQRHRGDGRVRHLLVFLLFAVVFFYRNMVKGQFNKRLLTSPSPLISCIKHERSFMSDVSTESITKFLTLSHDHLPIQFWVCLRIPHDACRIPKSSRCSLQEICCL